MNNKETNNPEKTFQDQCFEELHDLSEDQHERFENKSPNSNDLLRWHNSRIGQHIWFIENHFTVSRYKVQDPNNIKDLYLQRLLDKFEERTNEINLITEQYDKILGESNEEQFKIIYTELEHKLLKKEQDKDNDLEIVI